MNHPTEFDFVLPKGYLDPGGQLHRRGAMRLATASDEILPMQDARVRSNRNYLIVLLLTRVITRLGDLSEGEITPELVEKLYSPDIAYLQEFYRRINESGSSSVEAHCPSCGSALYVDLAGERTARTERS